MAIVYKLTDANGCTRGGMQWGPGITHEAIGDGDKLCSAGWIHFYMNPIIAVLMDPMHASFGTTARMWKSSIQGKTLHESLKSGAKSLTTIKEVPLPTVTPINRVAFSIMCAKKVCKDAKWLKWANKWLSGEDRSRNAAAHNAGRVAANAVYYAARAAANTYAYAATYAAFAAAAAYAARDIKADSNINFVAIANKAMKIT